MILSKTGFITFLPKIQIYIKTNIIRNVTHSVKIEGPWLLVQQATRLYSSLRDPLVPKPVTTVSTFKSGTSPRQIWLIINNVTIYCRAPRARTYPLFQCYKVKLHFQCLFYNMWVPFPQLIYETQNWLCNHWWIDRFYFHAIKVKNHLNLIFYIFTGITRPASIMTFLVVLISATSWGPATLPMLYMLILAEGCLNTR